MHILRKQARPFIHALWKHIRFCAAGVRWYPYMTTSPPPLSQVLQQYRGAFLTVRPSDIARWAMLAGADEGPANLRLTDHPLVQAAVLRALADDADWLQEAHDPEAVRLRLLAWAENLSPTSVTSVPMTPPPPPPPFPGALS